jgi:GNAT superfamily N-acetyltransferase
MFAQQRVILHDLGDGLIMRRASSADAEVLSAFNGNIHGENEQDTQRVAAWTHDLLGRPHPTLRPEDFLIVEEAATGRIVSSLNLIPQTWTYEGIEFRVGRPELVGTLPEYRNRGLVRAQFEEIHKWCLDRGFAVQAITGIPYYYRLFGYEMALDLAGRRFGYESQVPKLRDGAEEPYPIHLATPADLPFIGSVYEQAVKRHAIACQRTLEIFRYELDGQSYDNANHFEMHVIEDRSGEPVGYFQHATALGMTGLTAIWYELKPGVS